MILHSNIMGKGQPFVILHGFIGMGDNWKTLAGQFAEDGYEVHLVDQRNHGRSFHDEHFTYEIMANDLKEYCDAKGLDKIILLGHSMGGKTAMWFAVNYPERVSKLLVADIGPKYYPPHHQDILNGLKKLAANEEALTSRGNADEYLEKFIPDWGTRQFLLKNLYWNKEKKLQLRINLPVLAEKMEEIGEALPQGAVYEGKTLFLSGEKSDYIKASDKDDILKYFPNCEIVIISNAGHWLHAENPEDFHAKVTKFL
ncbi:MAG: alpha/beta hydrolase [Cytophagaceae bacterium]|nr:alpha/beta hydrolase [Cytophagaceae bacterium]